MSEPRSIVLDILRAADGPVPWANMMQLCSERGLGRRETSAGTLDLEDDGLLDVTTDGLVLKVAS